MRIIGRPPTKKPDSPELTGWGSAESSRAVTAFARDEEWAKLRLPSLEEFIAKRLAPLEKLLGGQDWLGESFTIADIAMVTVLRAIGGSQLLADHPATQAYVARGEARPAFQQAMNDQLAAFDRHDPPTSMGE